MKRISVLLAAMLMVVAVGGATMSQAKKTKKFNSGISLTHASGPYSPDYEPYFQPGTFSGNVTSGKKCVKGRTVTVQQVGGAVVDTTKTNNQGFYQVPQGNAGAGQYVATVEKKKIIHKKAKKKLKKAKKKVKKARKKLKKAKKSGNKRKIKKAKRKFKKAKRKLKKAKRKTTKTICKAATSNVITVS